MDIRHFKRIGKLRGWRETAFLVALAERHLVNLQFFAELVTDQEWPVTPVIHAQELTWRRLLSDQALRPLRQVMHVEAVLERLNEDESFGAQAARTACELIREALLSLENDHVRRAERVARQSLDLVMRYEALRHEDQIADDDDWVKVLDNSPLIEVELAFQKMLTRRLQSLKGPDREVLEQLRDAARQDGVSCLGIALDDEEGG